MCLLIWNAYRAFEGFGLFFRGLVHRQFGLPPRIVSRREREGEREKERAREKEKEKEE